MILQSEVSSYMVDAFVKIFSGVEHGWSARYKNEDEAALKSVEEHTKPCWGGLKSIPSKLLSLSLSSALL
ncbi:hypothetical protein HAX54_027045 [Datura stramonium]|uniref:Uncharacterized protein n=1 Tax=Datura stramonium TaxID=4076 RepID=A0ABS8V221_DATST|nr:hypothetical protein [Datura stramonium]